MKNMAYWKAKNNPSPAKQLAPHPDLEGEQKVMGKRGAAYDKVLKKKKAFESQTKGFKSTSQSQVDKINKQHTKNYNDLMKAEKAFTSSQDSIQGVHDTYNLSVKKHNKNIKTKTTKQDSIFNQFKFD